MFGWWETTHNHDRKNEQKIYGKKYGCSNGCRYLKRNFSGYECTQGVNLAWGLKSECKHFQA